LPTPEFRRTVRRTKAKASPCKSGPSPAMPRCTALRSTSLQRTWRLGIQAVGRPTCGRRRQAQGGRPVEDPDQQAAIAVMRAMHRAGKSLRTIAAHASAQLQGQPRRGQTSDQPERMRLNRVAQHGAQWEQPLPNHPVAAPELLARRRDAISSALSKQSWPTPAPMRRPRIAA
jgi:hypothetical protein